MNKNDFGLNAEDMDTIIFAVKARPEIEQAVIFGSRAMGNWKPASDIDLALKGNVQDRSVASIRAYLNEAAPAFPYKVDVVDYNSLENSELKKHIDEYGKIIYRRESLPTPPSKNPAGQ